MQKSRGRSYDGTCNEYRSNGLKSVISHRGSAVCDESRMHGAEWGKTKKTAQPTTTMRYEIVTYHYIRPIWIMILSLIIKERRCKKPLLRQASQCSLYVAKLGNIALQQWQIHYNRYFSFQVRLFRRTFSFIFLRFVIDYCAQMWHNYDANRVYVSTERLESTLCGFRVCCICPSNSLGTLKPLLTVMIDGIFI